MPLAWKKVAAATVIVLALGAQTVAIVRPSAARLYPFLDYPMYSGSRPPASAAVSFQLQARPCGADSAGPARTVNARALGYQDNHFPFSLSATARDRPDARTTRARLASLARTRLDPAPCVLEIWRIRVPTTTAGVSRTAIAQPQRERVRAWPVSDVAGDVSRDDDPAAVR